jgi:SAM-dependent methyltransferase
MMSSLDQASAMKSAPIRTALLRWINERFPQTPRQHLSPDEQTSYELDKASSSMGAYLQDCGRTDIDVLDYGCGWGGETLWLAERVRSVIGVDVERNAVAQAEAARVAKGIGNCRFASSEEGRLPLPDASVDAVFSTDTFEHVMDLDLAFGELYRVLRPGGVLRTRFGPLFYSPYGYHLHWACQVPYAHLLFGIRPILQLRNERAGTVLQAETWEDTGLNRKRFSDFRAAARRAGFAVQRFEPVAVRELRRLATLPLIGDLFTFGVDCFIRKPIADTRH